VLLLYDLPLLVLESKNAFLYSYRSTMSTPVVVQGTPVAAPAQQQHQYNGAATGTEHQPAKTGCNDPVFALLFYVNLAAIFAVAAIYGPGSFDSSTSNSGFDYSG
jgi:hypothetical protein